MSIAIFVGNIEIVKAILENPNIDVNQKQVYLYNLKFIFPISSLFYLFIYYFNLEFIILILYSFLWLKIHFKLLELI